MAKKERRKGEDIMLKKERKKIGRYDNEERKLAPFEDKIY